VVNFQADELFLDPDAAGRAVEAVAGEGVGIATVAAPLEREDAWRSESVVKVVRDGRGDALYFSRAPIPHPRGGSPELPGGPEGPWLRHLGLYAFTRPALERWTSLEPSPLERIERLEQLRALQDGMRIRVVTGPPTEPGVDEPEDLRRAERILANQRADGSPGREPPDGRG
jgi:3-deoxy-manno-octulosonate cytidylyltransferase (CMP-KDO synthetase)